jgi:hypothetical protein
MQEPPNQVQLSPGVPRTAREVEDFPRRERHHLVQRSAPYAWRCGWCIQSSSWIPVDLVTTDSAPTNLNVAIDSDPLEGCSSVRTGKRPRHLPFVVGPCHWLNPQPLRPSLPPLRNLPVASRREIVLVTFRKSVYSVSDSRARSASNWGVQLDLNYAERFFFCLTLSMATRNSSTFLTTLARPAFPITAILQFNKSVTRARF